jgi:ubiquinone/menaquinone biosynthesis C-methylase UbiE
VADLGSGTGAFPLHLLECGGGREGLRIDEIDYVREALERARARLEPRASEAGLDVRFVACNLDVSREGRRVPAADGSYDRVIASLLLNYVRDPSALLREARRLLRPGGRLVLSTLRRDADISRIYRDVSSELHAGRALELLGEDAARHLDSSLHEFLNEAARLLDLEEEGIFHFWDADELVTHLRAAGFRDVATEAVFGDPPQAIVASAVRS